MLSFSYGGLKAGPEAVSAGEIHLTVKGLTMISLYCFISGLSGVYTEYILKKKYQVINYTLHKTIILPACHV